MANPFSSFLIWFLPVVIAGSMAVGTMLGVPDAAAARDSVGEVDTSGGPAALAIMAATISGFFSSLLTMVAMKLFRVPSPEKIIVRFTIAVLVGLFLGRVLWFADETDVNIVLLLLVGGPVALTLILARGKEVLRSLF